MCGISGFFTKKKLDNRKKIIELMNQKLSHRGPDGEGYFADENVSLGHKRLAIIDLNQRSNQPFFDTKSNFVIVYNGEVYNYLEIKKILISEGVKFRTSCDTEVVLEAYIHWGENFLKKIKGMFSFAIYDLKNKKIFCARDHFGQKPFFYYYKENNFVFSSELTSLISNPLIVKELCRNSIFKYLHYDSFVGETTPIKNCFKLLPGHSLTFDLNTGNLIKKQYWKLDIKSKKIEKKDSYETFIDKLTTSTKIHLRSDVPLALYLSGGVDSSTIGLISSKILKHENIQAFNLKFKNETFNENIQAKSTANELKLNLKTFNIQDLDYISEITKSIDNIDEPLADAGFLAISLISKFVAQEGYKVTISGDGGDELLMGYEPFQKYYLFKALNFSNLFSKPTKNLINLFPDSFNYMGLGYKAKIFSKALGFNKKFANTRWICSFLSEEISQLLMKEDMKNFKSENIYDYIMKIISKNSSKDDYDVLSIQYQKHFLTDLICNHTDKANMQRSIEARSPFLDHELFDFTNELPKNFKIKNNKSKIVLRKFLKMNLKNDVYKNPKKGFTVPIANWLRTELKDLVLDTLNSKKIESLNLINNDYLKQNIINPHLDGKKNNYKKIWNIFVLFKWLNNNV